MQRYDAIVIGAGLMGCFTARHLTRLGLRVAVLERENDVSMGISRANTAIVYAGYDMKPGTLKARLTVEGNATYGQLCAELGVKFKRCGSLLLAAGPRGRTVLQTKLEQGLANGVPGLCLLSTAEVRELEPGVSTTIEAGLFAPGTGTVNPWQLCLAAALDAAGQDVEFFLEHEVVEIERGFSLRCSNDRTFTAPVLVNCSGLATDKVSELVAAVSFRLKLSGGSYLVLDSTVGDMLSHIVFYEPEIKGKGATFVPTIDGNIMLGPSQEDLQTQAFFTTPDGLEFVRRRSLEVFPQLPLQQTIRNFGTLRPNINRASVLADGTVAISAESIHDFYISWADGCPGLLNVAGVKTPGLTCADGIGQHVAAMVKEYL